MIVLISKPSVVVQVSPDEVSTWNAVWHPIIYRLQRQDFHIESGDVITNPGSGGDTIITIADSIITELEVGQFIYVNYSSLQSTYEVLEVNFPGGGVTEIIIDTGGGYSSPLDGGYINLITARSFYMMEVRIFRYDNLPSGEEISDSYAQFRPSNNAGDTVANIQSWLENLVTADNNSSYYALNELHKNLGQAYTLEAREYWKEAGYTEWVGEDLFGEELDGVVNAVKQTGDKWGQNMAEYVMQVPVGGPFQSQLNTEAKFLTKFEIPTCFVGYPFDLSYIQTEEISGFSVFKSERRFNINGSSLSSLQSELTTTISSDVQYLGVMRVSLDNYVSPYDSDVYRVDVSLYSDTFAIGNRTSEIKSVLINQECYDNGEYLAWLNPHGGFDYWLFHGDQEHHLSTNNEVSFERYVENLAEADARSQTLKKQIQTDMVLGADSLLKEDIEAIKYVLTSPKVYRYLGLDDDAQHKWQVVKVALGSYTMPNTKHERGDISFMIFPPETYNQQQ